MSDESTTATPQAEEPRASTPYARAGEAKIRLRQERAASAEPAADADTPTERDETAGDPDTPAAVPTATDEASPNASSADSAPGDEPEEDALAAARKARAERLAQRQAAMEAERAKRAEPAPAQAVDPTVVEELQSLKRRMADPEEFFKLAAENNLSPKDLGAYLQQSIEAPEELAAKRVREEMRAEIEAVKAQLEEERRHRAELEQQRQLAQVQNLVIEHTKESARTAPYAARFLERQGREEFLAYADKVATALGEDCTLQDLHDAIETNLERLAVIYGTEPAPQPTNDTDHAAAKAPPKTITNALAATRTTVGDEESLEDGPRPSLMERKQRARQKFRTG